MSSKRLNEANDKMKILFLLSRKFYLQVKLFRHQLFYHLSADVMKFNYIFRHIRRTSGLRKISKINRRVFKR